LLGGLQHHRWIATLRLAEQQVHMLGHHHVAYYHKVIALSHLLHHLKKQVAILVLAEQSTALVTAGSDKVGGWPTFDDARPQRSHSGCPILAFFARVGGDAACAI
jgi:hypothetical protein